MFHRSVKPASRLLLQALRLQLLQPVCRRCFEGRNGIASDISLVLILPPTPGRLESLLASFHSSSISSLSLLLFSHSYKHFSIVIYNFQYYRLRFFITITCKKAAVTPLPSVQKTCKQAISRIISTNLIKFLSNRFDKSFTV